MNTLVGRAIFLFFPEWIKKILNKSTQELFWGWTDLNFSYFVLPLCTFVVFVE